MPQSASRHRLAWFFVLLTTALAVQPQPAAVGSASRQRPDFGAIPPTFVRNSGQDDAAVRFVSVGGGRPIFLTAGDVRIVDARRQRSLWLTFVGGAARSVDGESPTGGGVTYLTAAAPARHQSAYRDVVYRRIWPGIDARVAGMPGGIEYSFELAPGADPMAIRLRYLGVDRATLNARGELVLDAGGETIVDRAPIAYQRINGRTVPVDVRFVQHDADVTFAVGGYDRAEPLVIDPTLVYSTFLHGSGLDAGRAIALDPGGAAYVAGTTGSSDFPTTPGAYQTVFRGGAATPTDAFIAKLNAAGDHFDYVTYLGGSGNDEAFGIAVDAGGNAYVTGFTESADFPTTAGAFRATNAGHDGFLTKLNAAGSALVYSTLLGATGTQGAAVAVDAGGNAYIAGFTLSPALPTTAGAVMSPRTSSGQPINDAFLLKFSADGSTVAYGTYIAGSAEDVATGVAVDAAGHAFVTGWTKSLDLRTTSGSVQPAPNSATYKSTDGGQTFNAANGGVRAADVEAIVIDPQQPANVYEASPDAGVLKSTDGGATWSRVLDGPAWDLVINPIAPSTIFAIAATGDLQSHSTPVLARSTDGGVSWTVMLTTTSKVAIAASNPSTLYASQGSTVVKSTDNGNTWTTVLSGISVSSVAVDPTNAAVVYAGLAASQIAKSTDGGASWTTLTVPASLFYGGASPITSLAVDPTQSSAVWAGAAGGLVRSTDGGASWLGVGGSPYRLVFDGATLYVADHGFVGSLRTTSDRGAHWTAFDLRGNTVPILGLAANAGVVFAGMTSHKDAFAYKIDTNATTGAAALVYGTYVGGALDDAAVGIGLDPAGNAVVGLQTGSRDLPLTLTTNGPRQMAVARISPSGASYTALTYTTGGSPYTFLSAIAVDRNGFAYTTGIDQDGYYLWIEQVDSTGASIAQYTEFNEAFVTVNAIAADAYGGVYVTGESMAPRTNTSSAPVESMRDTYIEKVSYAASIVDLARGHTAVASSIYDTPYAASNAVDGDPSTRWSSQFSDPQWIYVDLGQRVQIDHVVLRWETAYGREYAIQVSDDAQTWTNPPHAFSAGGTDVIGPMQGAVGRYVRMYGFQRGTQWGYSLWSFEVYGTPVSSPPPPSPLPSPWKSADVGAVGTPGGASYANGTFDVSGAGADIWSTTDAFQFVYQPISTDSDIVASVDSLQNTNPYAKAGIMFRESLDPGSRHVILDMRPDGGIEFMTRDATGGATTFQAGGSHAFPAMLRLSRSGGLFTAFVGQGNGWLEIGHVTMTMGSSLEAGLVVTSHDTSTTALATFHGVQVMRAFQAWPSPWTDDDVGAVGRAGSASYSSGTFTVNGSGADIWGTTDAFNYVSQPVSGDFSIVAHVAGVQNTNPFAKAGVDMRDTKTGSSAHVILDIRPDGTIEFMQRAATGASTTFIAGTSSSLPIDLMLVREGNTVTGAISSDGMSFTAVGQTTVAIAATTYAGLAVTSHDDSLMNTSTFDSAYVVNYAIHTRPQAATNVVVYANDIPAAALHGTWTKATDSTAAAGVKLVTPDNGVANTTNALAAPTDYVDVTFNANANTPYTIWLRLQAAANSKYNDSVWVQFSNATVNGSTVYQIGSPDGLLVNLATDNTGSSLSGWGWQNTAYWLSQTTTVMFSTSGAHTLRIQVREDGAQIDQIVLSPSQYLTSPPGGVSNDSTIVPKP